MERETTYSATDGKRPPKQSSPDRVCTFTDCTTVLSRYNTGDRCSVHPHSDLKLRVRGRKLKK